MKILLYSILLTFSQFVLCANLSNLKYSIVQYENRFDTTKTDQYLQSFNHTKYSIMSNSVEYECYIPVIENIEVELSNLHNDPTTLKQEKDIAIEAIRNFHLINRNTSVSLDSGYWRYMLRFDHDILQLHSEANVDGSIFINHFKLASWSDNDDPFSIETIPYFMDKDASDPYKFESDFELIKLEDRTKYVTQRLGNGEICDLTGIPRTMIINYKCNEKALAPVLKNIHEWRTCDYVMDLEASYFCRWPMWSSTSSAMKSNIECFPNEEVLDFQYPEKLCLQDSELKPLKTGIFFVKKRHNPYKFDILLTKRYDELDKLLYDITEGIRKKIISKKLVLRKSDKSLFLPSLTAKFTIGYDIYDFDLSFLGTVQIDNDSNGVFVSKLVDLDLPENTNCLDCNY